MSMAGISFSGLSSGIDSDSIISKLIALEGLANQRLQVRQAEYKQKEAVYGQLLDRIGAFARASGSLNTSSAFNPVSAASSDSAIASVTATADAAKGIYSLKVTRLAQAQKLATAAKTDTTSALNLSGSFVINGKAIKVEAADSLRSIAGRINDAGVGVTAGLIDGGSGAAYMTLTNNATGVASSPALADATGGVLASLGLMGGGTSTVKNPITNGASSIGLTDATTAVGTLLGATGLGAASFTVNGETVNVDLSADSLQGVADKINASKLPASTYTAAVVSETKDGTTRQRLQITATDGRPTFTDAGNALHTLGVLQRPAGNELVAGQDAAYSLDGVQLTSASNTVTGAIPGATITLLKADATTPKETTLALTRDTAAVKQKVKEFADAANSALGYIREASQFDAETYESGPLFGDSAARQFEASITTSLFQTVANPGAKYTNLAAIGFGMSKEGLLEVDDALFDKALADRPDEVRKLFQSTGVSTASNLTFISSTNETPGSIGAGLDVNISQTATKSSFVGGSAFDQPTDSVETLTFSGKLFGSANIPFSLPAGSTLASTLSAINNDSRLKDLLVASDDGTGKLKFESRKFGTGGHFAVASNKTNVAATTGVGTGGVGTAVAGLDVGGTIGGQAATGFGEFLTAAATNTVAKGLQLQYTGSTIGSVGKIQFNRGLVSMLGQTVGSFNDVTNGILTAARKTAQEAASSIDGQIEKNKAALGRRTTELKLKFAAMEQSISRLNAQGQQLSSLRPIQNN